MGYESKVKWERGSLFEEPAAPRSDTSKTGLSWTVGLGKLEEIEVGDMGYCNSVRKRDRTIGSFCKMCKMKRVLEKKSLLQPVLEKSMKGFAGLMRV